MATQNFDVIVLGNDFAGLVAATLCASRGLRVLLAETDKQLDTYQLGNESLPVAPFILSGLESPGVARVMNELHFQHLFKRRLELIERGCQLLAPGMRLEADPDRERFARAYRRETGKDDNWLLAADEAIASLPALLELDACMPPTGFWERREIGKIIARCHSDAQAWLEREHDAQSELILLLATLGAAGSDSASSLTKARALAHTRQGAARIQGDWKTWRGIFLDKFKSHNGELRRVDAQELSTGWSKVTGLKCVDDAFTCDYLIASMPADELMALVGKKPPKQLVELAKGAVPSAYRYTLNLIMQMGGLPEGMAPLAFSILDPAAPMTGGNFAILSQRPAAQGGRVVLTMQGLIAADADGDPLPGAINEELLAHARQIMPFLDKHLQDWDSPHALPHSSASRSLTEALAPSPVWHCPKDETLGLMALPYAAGLKQMCLAGAQTLPELGLEGQLIAGWSAAKLACAGIGKRKPSSRPSVLADAR